MRAALSLAFVALLASSSFAALSYKAGANVTLDSNGQAQFAFRSTAYLPISVLGYNGFSYFSLSVAGSQSTGQGTVTADALVGSAWVFDTPPVSFLAYYDSSNTYDISKVFSDTHVASAGYIATAFLRLVEKNPAGTEVTSLSLQGKGATLGGCNSIITQGAGPVCWTKTDESTTGDLKYLALNGSDSTRSGFTMRLTFILSSKVGILDLGNTPVGPRSLETILEIDNWPYQSASNTLGLEVLAASGSATATGRSFTFVPSGKTSAQVYFQSAGTVQVDGKSASVTASAWGTASLTSDLPGTLTDLRNTINTKFSGTATVMKQIISFPAGAKSIVYDPTVGQGQPLSGAVANIVSVAALAVFALIAMLFM